MSATIVGAPSAGSSEDEDLEDEEDEEDEEEEDAGRRRGTAGFSSEQLEQLKRDSLAKFEMIATKFEKMRKSFEKEGYNSKPYIKAQETISGELLGIRFTAKVVEKLCSRGPLCWCHRLPATFHEKAVKWLFGGT